MCVIPSKEDNSLYLRFRQNLYESSTGSAVNLWDGSQKSQNIKTRIKLEMQNILLEKLISDISTSIFTSYSELVNKNNNIK